MVADQYAPSAEAEDYKKFAYQRPLLNQGWGGLGSLTSGGTGMPFFGPTYTSNAQHIPASYTSGANMVQLMQGIQKG